MTDAVGMSTVRSEPLQRYLETRMRFDGFLVFVVGLAQRSDEVSRIAREALASFEPSDGAEESERITAVQRLRRDRQLFMEMCMTRVVDNFLTYLSELLALAYRTRPTMLLSRLREAGRASGAERENVPLEIVLEHSSIDDLIDTLVERRVSALAYRSVKDLQDYLDGQLGLPLFETDADMKRAQELVEQRNLFTHNRGVVNRHFLARVPDADRYQLGQQVHMTGEALGEAMEFLDSVAVALDARACSKWGLESSLSRASTRTC